LHKPHQLQGAAHITQAASGVRSLGLVRIAYHHIAPTHLSIGDM